MTTTKTIRIAGTIVERLLRAELLAALGPPGVETWWVAGVTPTSACVQCEDTIAASAVFAVLQAHVNRTDAQRAAAVLDRDAMAAIGALDKVMLAHNFDLENRVRKLEARPQITQAQFRQFMIDRYKAVIANQA